MRWENIKSFFGWNPATACEAVEIDPRPLSARQEAWIRDILQLNDEWRNANIAKTRVVAEGSDSEGFSIFLDSPEPENPGFESQRDSVGQIWIQTDDRETINVQLSHFQGKLQEIYVLFLDRKGRTRKLPETWTEVSREVVNL